MKKLLHWLDLYRFIWVQRLICFLDRSVMYEKVDTTFYYKDADKPTYDDPDDEVTEGAPTNLEARGWKKLGKTELIRKDEYVTRMPKGSPHLNSKKKTVLTTYNQA